MPIMNGYDATLAIRKYCTQQNIYSPKIFACTGHTEDKFIQKAWRSKMDEVIPKPMSVETIKQIINENIKFVE